MTDMPELRPAKAADLPALQILYQHLIPGERPASPDVAEDRLTALAAYPGSAVLVADLAGDLIATVTLIIVPNMTRGGAPYAFIENVVTHADFRGQGHGTRLLSEAERRAWDAGCYRIMIVSGDHNSTAHALYRSAGYSGSKIGFQKRRIADRHPVR
ncbi:GNAT family N-acetyltransferase [Rhodophyticola sp. CCM32]|uniref:GNAT family N-acetyltransferase n=1 Tax=Rhodophyticola sp. CCM32 TaxID=2916397 RepID=UPI00107EEBC0|nr:GNAT family N-acetyltransferase [Rhodophyticola sp. CCM32]QBY00254.1 GNAT family N-acetyltransferase [Rhodophyticola sp. CCM32]